jgi:hypothetical protein
MLTALRLLRRTPSQVSPMSLRARGAGSPQPRPDARGGLSTRAPPAAAMGPPGRPAGAGSASSGGGAGRPGAWRALQRAAAAAARRPVTTTLLGAATATAVWAAHGRWRAAAPLGAARGAAAAAGPAGLDAPVRPFADVEPLVPANALNTGTHAAPLRLAAAAAMIPHPAKEAKGGEDAWFVCASGRCAGVADGVGGWAEVGVDPGLYSRELMERTAAAAAAAAPGPGVPQAALEAAHAATGARGSCTACVACVHGGALHASNLGDSGFMVVRGGEVAFLSPQQQHEFNFPFQLGSPDAMGDAPGAAARFVVPVFPGA